MINLIKNNERIMLLPQEKKVIELPPIKDFNTNELHIFETDMELLMKGCQVIGHNLNDKSCVDSIKLVIYNLNIDHENYRKNFLYAITGSPNKIDIKPMTLLGKILTIKNNNVDTKT